MGVCCSRIICKSSTAGGTIKIYAIDIRITAYLRIWNDGKPQKTPPHVLALLQYSQTRTGEE